jgi:hypothetical protein
VPAVCGQRQRHSTAFVLGIRVDVRDAWHFLNGTDLNFGGGDETFGGGEGGAEGVGAASEEEVLLMMDGFGDADGDDLFGMAMLGNTNGLFAPRGGMGLECYEYPLFTPPPHRF